MVSVSSQSPVTIADRVDSSPTEYILINSPTMDLQFLHQLAQLHSALAVHVSTHSESLAPKHSSTQCLWLPEMLWKWGNTSTPVILGM